MRLQRAVTVGLALSLFGCSGDPAEPEGGESSMSAVINGESWQALDASGDCGTDELNLAGTDLSTTLGVAVDGTAPGTYDVTVAELEIVRDGQASGWTLDGYDGVGGTLTISEFTGTSAAGTFSLTLPPFTGATDDATVTDGKFDVPCV